MDLSSVFNHSAHDNLPIVAVLVFSLAISCTAIYNVLYQAQRKFPGPMLSITAGSIVITYSIYLTAAAVYQLSSKFAAITGGLVALFTIYNIITAIYNIYFHPLSKFPGPTFASASRLPLAYYTMRGDKHRFTVACHEKYGEVVRLLPNSLSFINDQAWRDIYMHRQGHPEMSKVRKSRTVNGAHSIIVAPRDVHARQRKVLAHAFSEKALREQEPLIKTYMDLLITNLREDAKQKRETNMVAYFNYLTFDLVGDLSFASPFDALKNREEHPWMSTFSKSIIEATIIGQLLGFPILYPLLLLFSGPLQKTPKKQLAYTQEKVKERIENGSDRPDFMAQVLKNNDFSDANKGMTRGEIDVTFNLLMLAGSETTATLLSGCMYLLARNEKVAENLKNEIRGAFVDSEDITVVKVNQLPYLLAVIEEALRLYPPVPISFNRRTPPEGASICGYWVPGNVSVGISQLAANHSLINFTSPDDFLPERFLPSSDGRFAKDRRAILQPFSAGPRNCIGKNLAYAEMKLALARIIYDFDFELADPGDDWFDQKVYSLWDKKPLMMNIREKVR